MIDYPDLHTVAVELGGYGKLNLAQFMRGDFSAAAEEDKEHLLEGVRKELIKLCEDAIRPQRAWRDRDSDAAHRQVGEAWALLRAGCEFQITTGEVDGGERTLPTDDETIWLRIISKGFNYFEMGEGYETIDNFYIPTRARLDKVGDKDWY